MFSKQSGNYSRTVDHMFILATLVDKCRCTRRNFNRHCMSALLTSKKKTYDSVWRQALLYKLRRLYINKLFFNILKSICENNEMCVRVSSSYRSHLLVFVRAIQSA